MFSVGNWNVVFGVFEVLEDFFRVWLLRLFALFQIFIIIANIIAIRKYAEKKLKLVDKFRRFNIFYRIRRRDGTKKNRTDGTGPK